jgi:RND family efflux transporter MFP subunit
VLSYKFRAQPLAVGLIAVGLITLGSVWACTRHKRGDSPRPTEERGIVVGSDGVTIERNAAQWRTIKIGSAVAAESRWTDPAPARIVIDESKTTRVGSPFDGRVTRVDVQRGESIAKGATLFVVASPELAELRSELGKALVEEQVAKVALDRTQALIDAQEEPGKDLLDAQQTYAEAQLAVRTAKAKLASLEVGGGGGDFAVTAPRSGVVVERDVDLGQTVTPDAGGLVVVADLSTVWVIVDLFEDDVGRLSVGSKAQVTLKSLPGKTFDGTVDQVSAVVDPDRHTVPIRVRLDNPDGALRPHAFAQVRFFEPGAAAVEVPASAVSSDGAKSYVYLATPGPNGKGDRFTRRDVTAGDERAGSVPIFSGLEVGDRVVVRGAVLLDNQIPQS